MMGNTYPLKNGFWIKSKDNLFYLGLNNDIIMSECINFSYVYDKLIVTKKGKNITIFSADPIEKDGKLEAKILANFSNNNSNLFANVIIDDRCYTIDYNCQVTACPVRKKFYPKTN